MQETNLETNEVPNVTHDDANPIQMDRVEKRVTHILGSKVTIDARQYQANDFIKARVEELLAEHVTDIAELLKEASKVAIGFQIIINFNDVPNTVQTTMSFSRIVKDRRMDTIGDPNQPELPLEGQSEPLNQAEINQFGVAEQQAEADASGQPKKRGRGRPRKVKPVEEELPHIVAGETTE
jgi:hypothetical protein